MHVHAHFTYAVQVVLVTTTHGYTHVGVTCSYASMLSEVFGE